LGPGGGLGMPTVISTDYYGFTWDPTGRYFFGLDGVAIGQFAFDAASGALQPRDPPQAAGSAGRQFLALESHPGGKWVYSAEEGSLPPNQAGQPAGPAAGGTPAGGRRTERGAQHGGQTGAHRLSHRPRRRHPGGDRRSDRAAAGGDHLGEFPGRGGAQVGWARA